MKLFLFTLLVFILIPWTVGRFSCNIKLESMRDLRRAFLFTLGICAAAGLLAWIIWLITLIQPNGLSFIVFGVFLFVLILISSYFMIKEKD